MVSAMNNTTYYNNTYEWRRQLMWQQATNPGMGLTFQILATFWLFFCILIGISANALVIRAFYKNKSVSTFKNLNFSNLNFFYTKHPNPPQKPGFGHGRFRVAGPSVSLMYISFTFAVKDSIQFHFSKFVLCRFSDDVHWNTS